jgi:hypothetical protein
MTLLRIIALPVLAAILGTNSASAEKLSVERVRFESGWCRFGPLQQKQARERGEELKPAPGDIIEGYLAKPAGDGVAAVYGGPTTG